MGVRLIEVTLLCVRVKAESTSCSPGASGYWDSLLNFLEGWINSLVLGDMEHHSELLAWSVEAQPLGP